MLQRQTQLGPLTCHVLQATEMPPRLAVVLCHGFGAPGDDLVALGEQLSLMSPSLAASVRWVFPEAPLSLAAQGYGAARAWWEIDLEQRVRRAQDGHGAAFRDEAPGGLVLARRQMLAMLEALQASCELPMARMVLGGFSQGAMVTTDLALSTDEAPAGLVILSGTLINQADWTRKAARRVGLRVLAAHGNSDTVLPFTEAEALHMLLSKAGLAVEFHSFAGGHTIPMPVLGALAKFLETTLS